MAAEEEEQAYLLGEGVDLDVPESHQVVSRHGRVAGVALLALVGACAVAAVAAWQGQDAQPVVSEGLLRGAEPLGRAEYPPEERPPLVFYMYRAGSSQSYALENVNAADLGGVMWYLHNEVVVSSPRKYKVDRIRRYKVSVKNTQEFWNVHHRNFGAFMAFDAARCTTPICGRIFSQYGFIVGCQVLPTDVAPYLGSTQTQVNGACKKPYCNAPVWYALPGPCPTEGLSNQQIAGNAGAQDVMKGKSSECLKKLPGGRCHTATGAPDCTYSYEEAGHITLDELVGINDYDFFWNGSYIECVKEVQKGKRSGPCHHNKEFDVERDKGVGCSFWDGKADLEKASARMKAVRDLFKKHFPEQPYDLEEPACDFDMYYGGETGWPINHTGSIKPSRGFSWEAAKEMKKTTTTKAPRSAAGSGLAHGHGHHERESCSSLGCGHRGRFCSCNDECESWKDCCEDTQRICRRAGHDEEGDGGTAQKTRTSPDGSGSKVQAAKWSQHVPGESKQCQEARTKCEKAVIWAQNSGLYEHPEWYKGLSASSASEDFRDYLAKKGEGACNTTCSNSGEFLVVRKLDRGA